jgi:hypothetical protein
MYGIFSADGKLLEGGFFYRDAAEDALATCYRAFLGAYVARQRGDG